MKKTIYEEMGGTYKQVGDYFVPNLVLPAEEQQPIGLWGQRYTKYLKQYHKVRYINLMTSGKLNSYLADVDKQAEKMFFRLVKEYADKQGVMEQLKAENQMEWVQRMNNIRACVREVVENAIVYQ